MYILLWGLWIIFAGTFTVEVAVIGLIVAAVVFAFICKFMDYSLQKEGRNLKKIFWGIRYVAVLLWEILKANVNVMKLILSPKYEVEPTIISFRAKLKSDASKVALANSITLTPGTITVSLDDNRYVIHCLDKDFAEGIEDSIFVELLESLEEKEEAKK